NCRRTSAACSRAASPGWSWSPARSSRYSGRSCCAPARNSRPCNGLSVSWKPSSARCRATRHPPPMNLALVHGRARSGVHAPAVRVEVHLAGVLPAISIVGLPEAAVRESKDRVRAAIQCAQFEFPARLITVNLSPADLPKDGARFDLAIALGILAASGQVPTEALEGWEFLGELALTGALRGTDGALAAALAVGACGRR